MYVRFGPEDGKSAETEEVVPGIVLGFDERGEAIAIEVLYIGRRATKPEAAA